MSYELQTPLTRITWRDGQKLTARDMNDAEQRILRFRWFHHLYMHGAASGNWGIVGGYEAAILASGDSIAVNEGYAIDASGRELILAHNVVVPLPTSVTGLVILAIRYQKDPNCCAPPTKEGCEKSPLGAQWEFPAFVWMDAEEFNPEKDIAIAGVHIIQGSAQGPLITTMRHRMRPVSSNRIFCDTTTSFDTKWSAAEGKEAAIWFETTVDTSAAGFVRTPLYFADLVKAERRVAGEATGGAFIVNATSESFTIRVLIGFDKAGLPANAKEAKDQEWAVSWMGFEPAPAIPLSKLTFLHLSGFEMVSLKFKI